MEFIEKMKTSPTTVTYSDSSLYYPNGITWCSVSNNHTISLIKELISLKSEEDITDEMRKVIDEKIIELIKKS